jgi:hypothetical protein
LRGCPALVAIRTSHIAFCDFSKELVTPAPCSKKGDRLQLVHAVSMVELEDRRVALAAIDAGMHA